MAIPETVHTITHLKTHAADLVRELHGSGGSVMITQSGEPKVVMVDSKRYAVLQDALALLKLLALGEADVMAGRTVSQDDAFARARLVLDQARDDG